MFCIKCGQKLENDDQFCNNCGSVTAEKDTRDYQKSLGYLWVVIINIIVTGVVIAIYDSIYESFEIIAVSLLILIYLTIKTFTMTWSTTTLSTFLYTHQEFSKIRNSLHKHEADDNDRVDEQEEFREGEKKFDTSKIKTYINEVFSFIIYVIVLFNLFDAL